MEFRIFGNTEIFVPSAEEMESMKVLGQAAFWSKVWPSAIALASFLERNAKMVANKAVVEIAAGLGLPSVVAANYAKKVTCSDLFSEPFEFVLATAHHHNLQNISCRLIDWQDFPPEIEADVVLLSDVNYDDRAFPHLLVLFQKLLEKNVLILLSTPERIIARKFINSLLPYCGHKEEQEIEGQLIHIFQLQKQP